MTSVESVRGGKRTRVIETIFETLILDTLLFDVQHR